MTPQLVDDMTADLRMIVKDRPLLPELSSDARWIAQRLVELGWTKAPQIRDPQPPQRMELTATNRAEFIIWAKKYGALDAVPYGGDESVLVTAFHFGHPRSLIVKVGEVITLFPPASTAEGGVPE